MDNQFDQLVQFIKQNLAQGVSESTLRVTLSKQGWTDEQIDKAFFYSRVEESQDGSGYEQGDNPEAVEQPSKYGVMQAIKDTLGSIRSNFATITLVSIISIIIVIASLFIIGFLAAGLLASTRTSVGALIGITALFFAWQVSVGAFLLAVTSIAVHDGATGEKGDVGKTLSTGILRLGRVMASNFLYGLIMFAPAAALLVLPVILFKLIGIEGAAINLFILLLSLVSIIWMFVAMVKFALLPFVALFEIETPIGEIINRCMQLMKNGGHAFIIKGYLLLLAVSLILSLLTGGESDKNNPSTLFLILVAIVGYVLSVIVNGVMVHFYYFQKGKAQPTLYE